MSKAEQNLVKALDVFPGDNKNIIIHICKYINLWNEAHGINGVNVYKERHSSSLFVALHSPLSSWKRNYEKMLLILL